MHPTWIYILRCADDSYYTGTYRGGAIETRVSEHNEGKYESAYTLRRRPVELAWAETFEFATDAINMERQIKGWSRPKKRSLDKRRFGCTPGIVKARTKIKRITSP